MIRIESTVSELLAAALIFGITYAFFKALGVRRDSISYSREDKVEFDKVISGRLGSFATVSGVFAGMTSLATVYIFFLGSSKLFGLYIAASAISVVLGAYVTNFVTRKLLCAGRVCQLLEGKDQAAAVLASLFWRGDSDGIRNSRLIKYTSLLNLTSVIWLEFAVVASVTGDITGRDSRVFESAFCGLSVFSIFFLVLKFGIRGFVFADLIQSPIFAVCTILLLAITTYGFIEGGDASLTAIIQPKIPAYAILIFVIQVFFVNSVFGLVNESHWLRLWIFGFREVRYQKAGVALGAIIWLSLILIGLVGGSVTNQLGVAGIEDILIADQRLSKIVFFLFWLAAFSALFSTADTNIFGLLVVSRFMPKSGTLRTGPGLPQKPVLFALLIAFAGSTLFWTVKSLNLPIEKLVFVLIPIGVNVLPTIVCRVMGRRPRSLYTIVSLTGYLALSVYGLAQPQSQLVATLSAALFPLLVCVIAGALGTREIAVGTR